jgi:parallel beta-helix repeat protein
MADPLVSDLRDALRGGAVVIAGAGVSVAASNGIAPGWGKLLADAIRWCQDHVPGIPLGWDVALQQMLALGDVQSMLATAQLVTDKMGGREGGYYRRFLRETFRQLRVENEEVPAAIAGLGVPIATTNYDKLIEKAVGWDAATWLDTPRLQQVFRERERVVAHLHGHWEEPRSVVLGIQSYDELLVHEGAQSLSHALAAMSSLVLIGVGEGTSDPNLLALRNWMKIALQGTAYPHFRLCRASERDKLTDEHKDEPIVPVVYGELFEDLAPFLQSLVAPPASRNRLAADVHAPPAPPGNPPDRLARTSSTEEVMTVDQLGQADFISIREALRAAPAGAQINVRPGRYSEELIIDKPVIIAGLGESPGDVKIVGQNGHTIQWTAAFGWLRNISLLQTAESDWYCIDIVGARLDIDRCDITSSALACIAVHNGADPIIRSTEIHDGNDAGIHILPGGEGTIVDCVIREFRLDAVRVDGGSPTIRRTNILDAGQSGIFVTNSGSGTYEDNIVSHSAYANVIVTRSANPVLRRNEIHDSFQQGVNVYDSGRGIFEDNSIHRNAYSNVEVSGGSVPSFRRNNVFAGWSGGFKVTNNSQGEYLHNRIYRNVFAGFFIDGGSRPVIANNVIQENGHEGIVVAADGGGKLYHNEVSDNARDQIVVADEARANVEQVGNRID